MNQSFKEWND